MNIEIVPAHDVPLHEQYAASNAAFAGYVAGWASMDASAFARFLCGQGADLWHSRFARVDGELAGFGYISRTGDVARLAGMGVVPAARGSGAANELLAHLLAEARDRRDRTMVLECFEQNPRALALYRRHGFEQIDRLLGWQRTGPAASAAESRGELREVSLLEATRWPGAREFPDQPWQVSRYVIPKLPPLARAFVHGQACLVVAHHGHDPIRISALFSGQENDPDWAGLRAALAALMRAYPDHSWIAPAIHQEEVGREVFEPLGFKREPLNQVLMQKTLV